MFWGREADLPADGTIGNEAPGAPKANAAAMTAPPPYALTAYELRRLLGMARAHGARFSVTYTRLPDSATHAHPAVWRDTVGRRVTLTEDPASGMRRCLVGAWPLARACDASEAAFAFSPPPPVWLSKVLMQYPVPLLPEMPEDPGNEVHCSA